MSRPLSISAAQFVCNLVCRCGQIIPRSHRRRGATYVVVAATVGATAVFLVARTAIDDVLRVKAEPVPHNRR